MHLKKVSFLIALVIVLIGGSLYAKIPYVLNFSGYLGSKNGELTGEHNITITIWDDPTATDTGHMLWTETSNIQVEQGRFHVLLGSDPNNPLPPDIFNKGDLYIEVRLDNEPPMKPRMRIVSVPYALNAQNAQTLDGKTVDTFATMDYLNSQLDTKADKNHNHDDRYYTKQQVDEALDKKVSLGQRDSITGDMVKDGTLSCSDMGDCGCGDGQLLKWSEQARQWECSDDTNTDTLGSLTCKSGQVAKYNGNNWECSDDQVNQYSGKDFALSMQACDGNQKVSGIDDTGHVICSADQDSDTLGSLKCNSGEIAKYNGSTWKCADDKVGLTGSGKAQYIAKFTDSNTLGNSVIQENRGNVGVGTAPDRWRLNVYRDINVGGDKSTNVGSINWTDTTTGAWWHFSLRGNTDDLQLHMRPHGTGNPFVPLTITTKNRVGINNVKPQTTLDVGGELRVGNTGMNCTKAIEGAIRYNKTTKLMEFCNGSDWISFGIIRDGKSKFRAARSCASIYYSGVASDNGVYWLDPDGGSPDNAFQAYCDMKNGGWTLIMKATGSKTFWYGSSYWTNTQLLHNTDLTLNPGDAKYQSFVSMKVHEMKGCLDGYCFVKKFDGTKTALQIFQGQSDMVSGLPGFGTSSNWSTQPHCQHFGINTPWRYEQVRFGYTANQENDCNSNDTAIGFGIGPNGWSGENVKHGAGYVCISSQCSKGNVNKGANGFLWIR